VGGDLVNWADDGRVAGEMAATTPICSTGGRSSAGG